MPQDFDVSLETLADDVVMLRVTGELDLGTSARLREPLLQASALHHGVVVDLIACEFLDSTAIAVVIRAWQATNTVRPGRVYLVVAPGSQPEKVLEICGVPAEVPTFADAEEALGELRKKIEPPAATGD